MFPGNNNAKGLPVGDIRVLARDRIVVTTSDQLFVPPACKRILKYRDLTSTGSITFETVQNLVGVGARALDTENESTAHERLHLLAITCVSINKTGTLIATGESHIVLHYLSQINLCVLQAQRMHRCVCGTSRRFRTIADWCTSRPSLDTAVPCDASISTQSTR